MEINKVLDDLKFEVVKEEDYVFYKANGKIVAIFNRDKYEQERKTENEMQNEFELKVIFGIHTEHILINNKKDE